MNKVKALILLLTTFLSPLTFAEGPNPNFEEVSALVGFSNIKYWGDSALVESINLEINSCSSFPYYNQEGSSNNQLIASIESGLNKLHQCIVNRDLPEYVNSKFSALEEILSDQKLNKYITCDFKNSHSYIAIATEDEQSTALEHYPYIRQYPGMVINTNRVSGNFRLDMNEEDINNTFRFYGGKIPVDQIGSGLVNPLANYISNPDSLVIHEMLHWTKTKHFNKQYPDIVYLTQACCFDQIGLDDETKAKSCDMLFDKDLYQEDEQSRLEAIKKAKVEALVKKLNSDLHSVPNSSRQY